MPDWNPDREGHAKHKWIVQDASPYGRVSEVPTSKGNLKFNDEGRFMLKDEGVANEIRTGDMKHEVTVTRVRYPDEADRGHRYFFGQFEGLPWKEYDELGRVIKETDDNES